MPAFRNLSSLRNLLAGVLLAALFIQAAIPAGYMADRSETGVIAARICGSDGVWLIPLENDGPGDGSGGEHEKQRADQPCTGGALGKAFVAAESFALPASVIAIAVYEAHHAPQIVAARTRALPPARGPPVTV